MDLRKAIELLVWPTTSKGSVSNWAGVYQCARSNGAPAAKKIENCPPSGPSHKRSSPPTAFMWGCVLPEAIRSRLYHPKLRPASPPTVLVSTRPCIAGQTAMAAPLWSSFNTISLLCSLTKETTLPKLLSFIDCPGAAANDKARAPAAAALHKDEIRTLMIQ